MQNTSGLLKRGFIYLSERFPLYQFVTLSLIFGLHASLFAQVFSEGSYKLERGLLSCLALFLFLFRLRLFDEFKDFEHDKEHYATRPVPRGLISLSELRSLVFIIFALELILSLYSGGAAFVFFIIALSYSLLLLKEFFAKYWLKKHFTVYIAVHEVLAIPIFFYLYSINIKSFDFLTNYLFTAHSLLLTASFFSLEVARKIRPKTLEIPSKDTYTAQYGIDGASKLLAGLSALSLIFSVFISIVAKSTSLIPLLPALVCFLYLAVVINKFKEKPNVKTSKKVFFCSIIYAILLNIGMSTSLWLAK
ncbi:MAG: UbiA family prenyltransferase [Candidatus Woykebacteria bacterium]